MPALTSIADLLVAVESGCAKEHAFENVELKSSWDHKYGVKLSALANKLNISCAWLVIGVADSGSCCGLGEAQAAETERIVSQQINADLDPAQACVSISCHEVANCWVVVVGLKNPGEVVYWKGTPYGGIGTTIAKLDPAETLALRLKLPGLSDYSTQPVSAVYQESLVARYAFAVRESAEERGIDLDTDIEVESVLRRLRLSDTQAARILFGDTSYRAVLYDDDGSPIANHKRSSLFSLLSHDFASASLFPARNAPALGSLLPLEAVTEAVTNAVAHAAYFQGDGDIQVEQFKDRLVVSNLCLRESGAFANRWLSRHHRTVNGLLMEALRVAGFCDELGRGKSLILTSTITSGLMPPLVVIDRVGRYSRWILTLYFDKQSENERRLYVRCQDLYSSKQVAMLAYAIVLWRSKKASEIQAFLEGDCDGSLHQVLAQRKGPVWHWKEADSFQLTRWAKVLLGLGQDASDFDAAEETHIQTICYDIATTYHDSVITTKELRRLAQMSDTPSERTLSSSILKRWCRTGFVSKLGKGKYRFIDLPGGPYPDFDSTRAAIQQWRRSSA